MKFYLCKKDLLWFKNLLSKKCFVCEIIPNTVTKILSTQLKHILIYKQMFWKHISSNVK